MTLEEYIDQKYKEESKYDFIDRDVLNYFTLTWRLNHLPINVSEEYIEESTNLYSGQIEQANLINDKFKNITNKENQTLKISKNEFKDIANVYFDNIDIFDENVKQINNILSNIEQRAYIGQLLGQITDILKNKKYKSIYQAIIELIKSEEYNKYKNLKKFVITIIHDKDLQIKYIESYRKITHTSLSDSKIIEQLNNKFNKFWFTLQKGIYQYIEKNHIVNESLLSVSTKNLIKQS